MVSKFEELRRKLQGGMATTKSEDEDFKKLKIEYEKVEKDLRDWTEKYLQKNETNNSLKNQIETQKDTIERLLRDNEKLTETTKGYKTFMETKDKQIENQKISIVNLKKENEHLKENIELLKFPADIDEDDNTIEI